MINLIAIGGEPATGKTTLMLEVIKLADDWQKVKPKKLLDAMYSKKLNLYILGKYEDDGNAFQGTDRLSMAVQPDAESFISETAQQKEPVNIIFEGDRLFNQTFLELCVEKCEPMYIVLLADKSNLEQRHADRQDSQSEKFKIGRETKIQNICRSLILFDYIHLMRNDTLEQQAHIMNTIKGFFKLS